MTSTFDWLERMFGDLENGRNLHLKEKAEILAEKIKKEIEGKVGKIKPRFEGWSWYFSAAHLNFDHTNKWHLKLMSRELSEELRQLNEEFKGQEAN